MNIFMLVTFFLKFYLLESCCCMRISDLHIHYALKKQFSCVSVTGIKFETLKMHMNVDKCRQMPDLVSFKDTLVFKSL